jgi:dihydrofolate synthase / folylpolyglutamate synthase
MASNETINQDETLKIETFEDAKQFLFERLVDGEKKLFGREQGIKRTEAWLTELGNPEERYPSIHIAGTSGKGSTSYMVSSLLLAAGASTGTITSPHVYDVRERMLLNRNYLSEEDFTQRTRSIVESIARMEKSAFGRPTYFEVLVGMAHQCFAEHKIDYGVIETGIGGRFDSTNTIQREDKLAVITRLGLDHTEILGETLEKIAWQKLVSFQIMAMRLY